MNHIYKFKQAMMTLQGMAENRFTSVYFFTNVFLGEILYLRPSFTFSAMVFLKSLCKGPGMAAIPKMTFKCDQNHTFWIDVFSHSGIEYEHSVWCHKNFQILVVLPICLTSPYKKPCFPAKKNHIYIFWRTYKCFWYFWNGSHAISL